MQETWAQSLDWEDPLEKRMATHSNIFSWRIPWTEEPGGLGSHKVGHDRATNTFFTFGHPSSFPRPHPVASLTPRAWTTVLYTVLSPSPMSLGK